MENTTEQKIGIRELKKNLCRIIEQINETGEPVTVTKRGIPVVEINPIAQISTIEYIRQHLKGSAVYFEETHHDTEED